jgi:hypothetical protein
VVTAGWTSDNFDLRLATPLQPLDKVCQHFSNNGSVDRIVYFDDSSPLSVTGIEEIDIPTLFFAVDSHLHAKWQAWYGGCFDKVLVVQNQYVEIYKKRNPNAEFVLSAEQNDLPGKGSSIAGSLISAVEGLSVGDRSNKLNGAAAAHFFTALSCLKARAQVRLIAFRELHRRLERVAKEGEELEEVVIGVLIMFKYLLDRFGLSTDSVSLFENFANHGLKNPLVGAAVVDSLLKANEQDLAKNYARRAFPGKKEILREAPEILSNAATELFDKVGVTGI